MKLTAFNNGYCSGNSKFINNKSGSRKMNFPATFFYLEISGIKILLDTGYSSKMKNSLNLAVKLYLNLTKAICSKDADDVLQENNINPAEINYIIISHFHPDHYGGLQKFENAKIICSKNEHELLQKNKYYKAKNLIFHEFIPKNIEENIIEMETYRKENLLKEKDNEKIEFFNILNLDEVYSFYLEGHTKGHIGIYLKSLDKLLIFDAVWCKENLEGAEPRKILKKLSLFSEKEYRASIERIKRIISELNNKAEKNIELIISHEEKYMRSPYEF